MSTGHGDAPLRLTPAVRIAAVLATGYGIALVALAVVLATDWASHRGNVGHLHSVAAHRGVASFIVACIAGAALLMTGSVRARRGARGLPALIPLGLIVAIGCVGEPIDILTGVDLRGSTWRPMFDFFDASYAAGGRNVEAFELAAEVVAERAGSASKTPYLRRMGLLRLEEHPDGTLERVPTAAAGAFAEHAASTVRPSGQPPAA